MIRGICLKKVEVDRIINAQTTTLLIVFDINITVGARAVFPNFETVRVPVATILAPTTRAWLYSEPVELG